MPKIKVLMVYPEVPLTFWSFRSSVEYVGKKAGLPPTGLATVAAMLPEDKFELERIIDMNVEPLKDRQIDSADIILTSTMVVQEDSHNEVIRRARRHGKQVVAGGPFPTSYPERVPADYIVAGEAELTLKPFVEDFLAGKPKRIYTEKSVGASGKPSLIHTPIPRWDLLRLNKYASVSIQYSRGCPFSCEFCDIASLNGKIPRTKAPEQVIGELDSLLYLHRGGSVFILDDNFIGNAKNVRILLPELIRWQKKHGYPFNFYAEASMNLAWNSNKDILENMVEAGFDSVFLGIENPDPESVRRMNKAQNAEISPLEAVRTIQRAGMEVTGGFIVGSDGDKKTVCDDLFNFIQEAGIPVSMPGLLVAIKGTDLYRRLEKEERFRQESRGDNTHHLGFNFRPKLDEEFLIKEYAGLLSRLFDPKNYYERCRTLQRNLGNNNSSGRAGKDDVSALFKSLGRQLFAPGGWEYTKFLASTLAKKPRQFPNAVAYAIKLDHFGKLTRAATDVHNYQTQTESLYERFTRRAGEIYGRYRAKHELSEGESRVRTYAAKIISRAEARYSKLHKDFRGDARNALENLKERVHKGTEKIRARYLARQETD